MKTLDLARKDTVDVDTNAQLGLEHFRKLRSARDNLFSTTYTTLVLLLDVSESLAESGVIGHRQQLGEQLRLHCASAISCDAYVPSQWSLPSV